MSIGGTAAHQDLDGLPPLVERAVELAAGNGFEISCLPEQGGLLALLAAGRSGETIGETGTGYGVGLAWMVSAASPQTGFFSVELDADRARAARELFAETGNVTILHGDWTKLVDHAPFDLLVLDGGGAGKRGEGRVDPADWLRPAGMLVIDDFTPTEVWPPVFGGATDEVRLHWLEHPELLATEVRTSASHCAILGHRK